MKRSAPLVRSSKILARPCAEPKPRTPLKAKRAGQRRTEAIRDASWLDQVRSIELCVRCGAYGVEAAHRDFGKGIGIKTDDPASAALCRGCHTILGEGKAHDRDQRRAEMDRWIVETVIQLARTGKIGVVKA